MRFLLCACFRVTRSDPFCCPSLPRFRWKPREVPRSTGTSVLRVVAHDWRCDEESQPGCRGKRLISHHGSCLPGAMTQKGRRQQKEWKCGECQRWTWGGSKCWYCGSYGSMEQKGRILGGRCKSGECLERGHHSDSAASRESVEEHECWSSRSCKRCDCQQNRDSEAGSLCEGTVSCPA